MVKMLSLSAMKQKDEETALAFFHRVDYTVKRFYEKDLTAIRAVVPAAANPIAVPPTLVVVPLEQEKGFINYAAMHKLTIFLSGLNAAIRETVRTNIKDVDMTLENIRDQADRADQARRKKKPIKVITVGAMDDRRSPTLQADGPDRPPGQKKKANETPDTIRAEMAALQSKVATWTGGQRGGGRGGGAVSNPGRGRGGGRGGASSGR